MSTRTYDYKLTLTNAAFFNKGRFAVGNSSGTIGEVISQDLSNNTIKVKVNNNYTQYQGVEYIHCNVTSTNISESLALYSNSAAVTINSNSFIINGSTNTFSLPMTTTDGATALDVANVNAEEINIKFDRFPLERTLIVYPSTNNLNGLGRAGFDVKPIPFSPGNGLIQGVQSLQPIPWAPLTIDVNMTNLKGRPISLDGIQIDASNTRQHYVQVFSARGSHFGGTDVAQVLASQAFLPDTYFDTVARETNNANTVYASYPFTVTSNIQVRISTGNTESVPYTAPSFLYNNTVSIAQIAKIEDSGFIRAKNAFEQPPLVRLYDVFYPGEWFPPTETGNPSSDGLGLAWPSGFPYRFAEVRGDTIADISYRAYYNGDSYLCYPVDSGSIGLNQTGEINEVSVKIANFDSLIAQLVEDAFLVGNCSNTITGTVNFEQVHNLDPATVVNSATYDQTVVDSTYAGIANSAITYDRCAKINGKWVPGKQDSRDMLGGIVRIRSTFATFLDYWPEYSSIRSTSGNVLELYSTAPYRINDNVTVKGARGVSANVKNIVGNFIELDGTLDVGVGTNLMIVNPDADPDAYVEDTFKIDKLNNLTGGFAEFSLTSWLQYFKLTFPRRKYYKNTCPWVYKGEECQYPSAGTGTIPGTSMGTLLKANGFWTVKNVQVDTVSANDDCAKSFVACKLRNNQIHFGGFIGTGRTVPQG